MCKIGEYPFPINNSSLQIVVTFLLGTESQNPRNESQQDKIPVAAIAVPVVLIILFAVIAVAGVVLYRK